MSAIGVLSRCVPVAAPTSIILYHFTNRDPFWLGVTMLSLLLFGPASIAIYLFVDRRGGRGSRLGPITLLLINLILLTLLLCLLLVSLFRAIAH